MLATCVIELLEPQKFQLVQAFEEVNNIKIPYEIVDRRAGDIATVFADVGRAEQELGWKSRRGIREMVQDSWRFESRI